MVVELPDEIVRSLKLTEADVKLELGLTLFQQDRLTLGQAVRLAGLPQLQFQRHVAMRDIPLY